MRAWLQKAGLLIKMDFVLTILKTDQALPL